MAYVNERVKPEERRTFSLSGWGRHKTPTRWTIDREKDYILFKILTERENPDEILFGFYYKGKAYELDMRQASGATNFEWRFYGGGQTYYPADMLEELRKAFAVYGFRCMTPEEVASWKMMYNEDNHNGNGLYKAGF